MDVLLPPTPAGKRWRLPSSSGIRHCCGDKNRKVPREADTTKGGFSGDEALGRLPSPALLGEDEESFACDGLTLLEGLGSLRFQGDSLQSLRSMALSPFWCRFGGKEEETLEGNFTMGITPNVFHSKPRKKAFSKQIIIIIFFRAAPAAYGCSQARVELEL